MKNLSFLLPFLFVLQTSDIAAQVSTFQSRYGGGTSRGNCVQQTTDGGFIMCGDIYNQSLNDYNSVYIVKTDSAGNVAWTKEYGTQTSQTAKYIQQTLDGGFIVTGTHFNGISYLYLLKTDMNGNQTWQIKIGGTGNFLGNSVQQTSDSGYIISGTKWLISHNNKIYIVKASQSGAVIWAKYFGDSLNEEGYFAQETNDHGYVVTGYTTSFGSGNKDVYLGKLDSAGNVLWTKAIGGSGYDIGYCVRQTNDNGFIVCGSTSGFGSSYGKIYLVKTDDTGNLLWSKTFSSSNGGDQEAYSVQQTSDNGYIISGVNKITNNIIGVYLVKTDDVGNPQWAKTYTGFYQSVGKCVQQTNDNGYAVMTGMYPLSSYNVFALIKTDSTGYSGCSEAADSIISTTPATVDTNITVQVNSTAPITSFTTNSSANATAIFLCSSVGIIEPETKPDIFSYYPNPVTAELEINFHVQDNYDIRITNLFGVEVYNTKVNLTKAILNLNDLKNGIYFLRVRNGKNNSVTKRIFKVEL